MSDLEQVRRAVQALHDKVANPPKECSPDDRHVVDDDGVKRTPEGVIRNRRQAVLDLVERHAGTLPDALREDVRRVMNEQCLGYVTVGPESQKLAVEMLDGLIARLDGAKAGKRKRRRTPPRDAVPLTPEQVEALQLLADHKGNYTAAAKAAGISRPALTKRYKKAMKKLPRSAAVAKKKPTTRPLPLDRRGQVNISDEQE
jgi:predicted DNA-binding protein (UPF0251 family)